MTIKINNGTAIPIYEQLYNQLKLHIVQGLYQPEDQLPSIRGLAKETKVSVITVKKAYEDLERDGFIYSIPSKGYYVKRQNEASFRKYYESNILASLRDIRDAGNMLNLTTEELLNFIKKNI